MQVQALKEALRPLEEEGEDLPGPRQIERLAGLVWRGYTSPRLDCLRTGKEEEV